MRRLFESTLQFVVRHINACVCVTSMVLMFLTEGRTNALAWWVAAVCALNAEIVSRRDEYNNIRERELLRAIGRCAKGQTCFVVIREDEDGVTVAERDVSCAAGYGWPETPSHEEGKDEGEVKAVKEGHF